MSHSARRRVPRVALDARWIQPRPLDGVGRYLHNVLPLLAEGAELDLLVAADRPVLVTDLPRHTLATPGGRAVAWMQWSAPRWLRDYPGIFHTPWYGLPYWQPVPMVVTIHDVLFETHRQFFPPAHRMMFRAQARRAAKTARVILTVSEHVKGQILDCYGGDPDRVLVAHHGVDPVFFGPTGPLDPAASAAPAPAEEDSAGVAPPAALRRLSGRPYLVAMGNSPRRNLPVAVASWRAVRAAGHDVDLVVIGETLPREPGLLCLDRPDDAEWSAVLSGAVALVYPTRDEGFGLPALEAAASGTPVICARVGALPEVLGDAAAWCEAPTTAAVSAVLGALLADPDRARALSRAGRARAATYSSWQPAADTTLRAYAIASA